MLKPEDFPWPLREDVLNVPQSIELPGTKKPGQTGHYVNNTSTIKETWEEQKLLPKTTYEIWRIGVEKAPDTPVGGFRPWNPVTQDWEPRFEWSTYTKVDHDIRKVGSALVWLNSQGKLGPKPTEKNWMVGCWFPNRIEWQIATLGANAYSIAFSSLYDTLPLENVEYCIQLAEMRAIFTTANHIPDLISLAPKCPSLKAIICVDGFESMDLPKGGKGIGGIEKRTLLNEWAKTANLDIYDWPQILEIGNQHLIPPQLPDPQETALLCFTSGTTGKPKGAIYTHDNVAASVWSQAQSHVEPKIGDTNLAFLPLSHCYAYFADFIAFMCGTSVAYPCGDLTKLIDEFAMIRPTFIVAVPRIINRIYALVKEKTLDAPGFRGSLFRRAYSAKLDYINKYNDVNHPFWDKILFNKVKQVLGGRLEAIGTGSAPVAPAVLEFMRVVFGCRIIEGYGSTEGVGTCTKSLMHDMGAGGTVGFVLGFEKLKLVDVPEMGYTSNDKPHPRGEICMKGPQVIKGYYKDPEKTQELFDEEGFLRTGDIGSFDDMGRLKIVDRIKSLVKLAQGEYVAVEKVESALTLSGLVQQVFAYGDGLRNHLIAFVVVQPAGFADIIRKITGDNVGEGDLKKMEKYLDNTKVNKACLQELRRVCKLQNLNGVETPKQTHLLLDVFPAEMMTPTLKLKRNIALSHFKDIADRLYDEYDRSPSAKL